MRARVGQKVKPQEKPPEQRDGAAAAVEAASPQVKN
jgi:hypothetical protein